MLHRWLGGKEGGGGSQMKYGLSPLTVWLSHTSLATLIFTVAPLPQSQPAACLQHLAANPPTSTTQPLINQKTHTLTSLSSPLDATPPILFCIICHHSVFLLFFPVQQEVLTSEDLDKQDLQPKQLSVERWVLTGPRLPAVLISGRSGCLGWKTSSRP